MFRASMQLRHVKRVVVLLVLWSAAPSVAKGSESSGTAVIPPGQEQLLGDMLGLGAEIPRCTFAGAQAEHEIVRSRYACQTGEVVIELRHPSRATNAAIVTDRFVIVVTSGAAPEELTRALEARIRERESEFEWTWTAPSGSDSRPPFFTRIANAGVLTLLALSLFVLLGGVLLHRLSRRTRARPGRASFSNVAGSTVTALALAVCVHFIFRATGMSFVALIEDGRLSTVFANAGLVVLLVVAAAVVTALLVRLAPTRGVILWAALVVVAYFLVGWRLSLLPDDLHYFGRLSTFPPHLEITDSVAGNAPVSYRINRLGFRKPDFDESRADGVIRVVLVGDSFVFGTGVDYEGTLPFHLERELREKFPGRKFEVLNLGIPGDNLSSHVELYAAALDRLRPDVVILCMILVNDLSRWDEQIARQDARRMSPFSFVRFLAGDAVEPLWALMHLEQSLTAAGLAHLESELSRVEQIRKRSGQQHVLAIFGFSPWEMEVASRLEQVSDAIVIPNRTTLPEEFIAGDGHPTSIGNERSAEHIATTLSQSPAWHRLLEVPTPNP